MKRIYKYKLGDIDHQKHIILDIPLPAKILSVAEQYNDVVLYTLIDDENGIAPVDILIVGTGMSIFDNIDSFKFIWTVKLHNGKYMFHIFYRYIDSVIKDEYKLSDSSVGHLKETFRGKDGYLIS